MYDASEVLWVDLHCFTFLVTLPPWASQDGERVGDMAVQRSSRKKRKGEESPWALLKEPGEPREPTVSGWSLAVIGSSHTSNQTPRVPIWSL